MKSFYIPFSKKIDTYKKNNAMSFTINRGIKTITVILFFIFSYEISIGQEIKMNASKYLLTPSAFQLKEGQTVYRKTNLYMNSLEITYSDYLSFEAGLGKWYQYDDDITPLGTIINLSGKNMSLYFNVKAGTKIKEDLRIGGGALLTYSAAMKDLLMQDYFLFCPYVIVTHGSENQNISLGTGWNLLDLNDNELTQAPFLNIAGASRISKYFALITENFFIPNSDFIAIFSYGIRFFTNTIEVNLAFKKNPDTNIDLFGTQAGSLYSDISIKF
ncbi:MAG: hypothetical protein GY828_08100 [Candidatus Gracilibacteria bacterium]|nr:hypothetical protein [Candidatus Gracilibacteria bacterium]